MCISNHSPVPERLFELLPSHSYPIPQGHPSALALSTQSHASNLETSIHFLMYLNDWKNSQLTAKKIILGLNYLVRIYFHAKFTLFWDFLYLVKFPSVIRRDSLSCIFQTPFPFVLFCSIWGILVVHECGLST